MDTTTPTIESLNASLIAELEAMACEPLTQPIGTAQTVRDLFAVLEQRGDYESTDHALHTLITRVADGDRQARQLLLFAMRPGLASLAWSHHLFTWLTPGRADAFCTVVDVFYDVLERPGIRSKKTRVASRVIGQVRTQLDAMDAEWMAQRPTDWDAQHAAAAEDGTSVPALEERLVEPTTAHESQLDLLEALAWARDAAVITLEEARFLLAIYSPDSGMDLETLGYSDLTPAAIRKRASRLSQRIAQAVAHSTVHEVLGAPAGR